MAKPSGGAVVGGGPRFEIGDLVLEGRDQGMGSAW